jgi:hypothetical protein
VKSFRRLSILLAAFAVLVMSTAYVAHLHKQELLADRGGADHCELCLQIGRTAGPSPLPSLIAQGTTYCIGVISAGVHVVLSLKLDRAQQARAPPSR